MKIVIACDSFKGCLSAKEVCNSIRTGILSSYPSAEVLSVPVSDGGEGFLQCFYDNCGGDIINNIVSNPVFKKINADYMMLPDKTAVVETAAASGIALLDKKQLNPLLSSTYGTGELIKNAVKNGAKRIILGLGGSATNDGGMGALAALGVRFLDKYGNELVPTGENMIKVSKMQITGEFEKYKNPEITLACDVENPFYGENGAAHVFSPQKGADGDMVKELDSGLKNLAELFREHSNIDLQEVKGAGAAGGLCGGLFAMLNCKIESGFEALCKAINFKEKIKNADLIITGEGKTDNQTFFGKLPKMVADTAKEYNTRCVLISGDIESGCNTESLGFYKAYKIRTDGMPLQYAIKNADMLLKNIGIKTAKETSYEKSIEKRKKIKIDRRKWNWFSKA